MLYLYQGLIASLSPVLYYTNMDSSVEDINFVKGQKLFITLADQRNLEGTYSRKSVLRKSIILFNVTYVPSNGKSFDQLEFKLDEIVKMTLLEVGNVEGNKSDKTYDPACDTTPLKKDGTLYIKIKKIVENHIFIDQMDSKFVDALRDIGSVETFAVHGEGTGEGRFSHLSILSLATQKSVFLFDVISLGHKVFKGGNSIIKKKLESTAVLKIVHDCSLLSDCLMHKFEVKLCNVFDTQACHFVIHKNLTGRLPPCGHLGELTTEYLKLPSGVCNDQVTSSEMWRKRPLKYALADAAAWRVAVVRRLKQPLDDALYAPFDRLCNLYLSSVRDTEDELEVRKQIHLRRRSDFRTDVSACSPSESHSEDSWST